MRDKTNKQQQREMERERRDVYDKRMKKKEILL